MKNVILFIVFSFFALQSCCSLCYTGKPSNTISLEKATDLENEWVATRAESIQRNLRYEDTREFNFTFENLEQYLGYVKHLGDSLGIDKENLGIRIYFGAYPNRGEITENDDPGYATVFLIPTHKVKRTKGVNRSTTDSTGRGSDYDNLTSPKSPVLNMVHGGKPPKPTNN